MPTSSAAYGATMIPDGPTDTTRTQGGRSDPCCRLSSISRSMAVCSASISVFSATRILLSPQRMPKVHPFRIVVCNAPQPFARRNLCWQSAIAAPIATPIWSWVAAPHAPSGAMVRTVVGAAQSNGELVCATEAPAAPIIRMNIHAMIGNK